MAKTGRPSAYKPEYDKLAYQFSVLGATDAQMADFFGVSTVTLNAWKKRFPEFLNSLKKGKMLADAQVATALIHRARGYSHSAVKMFLIAASGDKPARVLREEYVEHYPPDTGAAAFWLKNRRPDLWRDKPVEVMVDDDQMKDLIDAISGSPKN